MFSSEEVIDLKEDKVRKMVREGYAKVAREHMGSNCSSSICCDKSDMQKENSRKIGYSDKELDSVPAGASISLGCGNPVALASLKKGETVLDLGSGGGLDCFLAAKRVGETGKVIGVDMTPEMLDKARENARKGKYTNVQFRLGEIENLPVADNTVDAVISNCVINLSPNKQRVFEEAFRTLKLGGRLMISDIVLDKELPESVKENTRAYIGCVSGAVKRSEYLKMIEQAGFEKVKVIDETRFSAEFVLDDPNMKAQAERLGISLDELKQMVGTVSSVKVYAMKPKT